jgi:zinc transport system substrate-binding protein
MANEEKKMNRLLRFLCTALLAAIALIASTCGSAGGEDRTKVAVSIAPLADFVRQVGGERVQVEQFVPGGASAHTYEPKPSQVRFLATADILVLNGLGLEFWADKVVDSAGNDRLLVVDTSRGIETLEDADEAEGNPHIWLDPENAIIQVGHIEAALVQVDAANADFYRANAQAFVTSLRALDDELKQRIAAWRNKDFVAFHAAWDYFARHYGLRQVAVIEEFPGKEPSPKYLADVVDKAKRLGASAIFAEPQFSPKAAEAIARESGKRVIKLDPLGGTDDRKTYVDLLRYNVGRMEEAMK